MTPAIETTRLLVLPLHPDDAAEMAEVLADPALYGFIGGSAPAAEALEARYRGWLLGAPRPEESWHNWIIRLRDGGAAIGHLQATVIDSGRTADIAWVVGTPWQRRGYATEAAIALVQWLEATEVGVITAHVHPDNVASALVAGRAGLVRTDTMHDGEFVWQRDGQTAAHG